MKICPTNSTQFGQKIRNLPDKEHSGYPTNSTQIARQTAPRLPDKQHPDFQKAQQIGYPTFSNPF